MKISQYSLDSGTIRFFEVTILFLDFNIDVLGYWGRSRGEKGVLSTLSDYVIKNKDTCILDYETDALMPSAFPNSMEEWESNVFKSGIDCEDEGKTYFDTWSSTASRPTYTSGKVFSPDMPMYSSDREFLGITEVTTSGLCLFPKGNPEFKSYLEQCNSFLPDVMLTDLSNRSASYDSSPAKMFKDMVSGCYGVLLLPVIGVSGDTLVVKKILVYKISNNYALELDMSTDDGRYELLRVLELGVSNCSFDGKNLLIYLAQAIPDVDTLMHSDEERALYALNNPADLANLRFEESSQEYRLLCPQFRMESLLAGSTLGYDKLHIYNLSSAMDFLYVICTDSREREVIVHSGMGNISINSIAHMKSGDIVHFTSNTVLNTLEVHAIGSAILKLQRCTRLEVNRVNEVQIESGTFDDLKLGCIRSLSNSTIKGVHGIFRIQSAHSILRSTLSDIGILLLQSIPNAQDIEISNVRYSQVFATKLNNVKFDDKCALACFSKCEFIDVHISQRTLVSLYERTSGNTGTIYLDAVNDPSSPSTYTFLSRWICVSLVDLINNVTTKEHYSPSLTLDFTSDTSSDIYLNFNICSRSYPIVTMLDRSISISDLSYLLYLLGELSIVTNPGTRVHINLGLVHCNRTNWELGEFITYDTDKHSYMMENSDASRTQGITSKPMLDLLHDISDVFHSVQSTSSLWDTLANLMRLPKNNIDNPIRLANLCIGVYNMLKDAGVVSLDMFDLESLGG